MWFVGTQRQSNTFVNSVKNIHPDINFTIEVEKENQIDVLDLTLNKLTGKHNFAICHKRSHTDITIYRTSVHPYKH